MTILGRVAGPGAALGRLASIPASFAVDALTASWDGQVKSCALGQKVGVRICDIGSDVSPLQDY